MALSAKSDALKHVPWFSLTEWHQVYKQIYSNDTLEQTKAYETLLVWKARLPKLPVGVECTLSIIQVCLRDREWTPKIDSAQLPMHYESDLCLMYSTTIMRFLNHISNVGHTKQTSLFQIAKQLKIPEWIVNLRHDAAHGHELPSIGALRMAANVLLVWLHEEYWAAEAKAIEERFEKFTENLEADESSETQAFVVFLELWIAVGLYIKANYKSVFDLPDAELRRTLINLRSWLPDSPIHKEKVLSNDTNDKETSTFGSHKNENNYPLTDAQKMLFSEISTLISKNKSIPNVEEIVMKTLLESEAFLPGPDFIGIFLPKGESFEDWKSDSLPVGMTDFWHDLIVLIHEKKLLDELIWRLIELVNSKQEETNQRNIASMWLNSIAWAFVKLRVTQGVTQAIEHSLDDSQMKMSTKVLVTKVRKEVNESNPELSEEMWLNTASEIPAFMKDINFVTDILLNANEFTIKFISPFLQLVTPQINQKRKEHLLKLVKIHANNEDSKKHFFANDKDRMYSVDDLIEISGNRSKDTQNENGISQSFVPELGDKTIRNNHWEIAPVNYDWAECPFGVLPWQLESLAMIESEVTVQTKPKTISIESSIVPGLLDDNCLTTESRVNWDHVLRKKKRVKRKRQRDVMMDRAIEMVKKRQK